MSNSITIIGNSPKIKEVLHSAEKSAATNASVIITGETGTGKELIAQKIHSESRCRNHPFIAIDCGALPETLLESELFGHVKGAFTGAVKEKKGIFERANRGTVFLDEIGNASQYVQYKLLRVLQEKQFTRLGGDQLIFSDFRLICATNENLIEKVQQDEFRTDLFFRLSVFPIHIPPLRDRKTDIPLLIEHFINKYSDPDLILSPSFKNQLIKNSQNYNWYGNIRELENYIEYALALNNPDCLIDHSDLFDRVKTSEQYQFTNCSENNARILESCINDIIDQANNKNLYPDDKLRRINLQNVFNCSKDVFIRTVNASQGRLEYVVRKNGKFVKQKTTNCIIYPASRLNRDAIAS